MGTQICPKSATGKLMFLLVAGANSSRYTRCLPALFAKTQGKEVDVCRLQFQKGMLPFQARAPPYVLRPSPPYENLQAATPLASCSSLRNTLPSTCYGAYYHPH